MNTRSLLKEKIELLSISLLEEKTKLKEIDRWLNVLNRPNGWHYDLDIIWTLMKIEDMKLPKGSTILDVGGGLGITQYILASRGYNIISLDFAQRKIQKFSKVIFDVVVNNSQFTKIQHDYMDFMKYEHSEKNSKSLFNKISTKIINNPSRGKYIIEKTNKLISNPIYSMYLVVNYVRKIFNLHYVMERYFHRHNQYGKITFLRGSFNSIPLDNESIDCAISISAFEHNTYADMQASVIEFMRVLKNKSFLLLTTSAAKEKDWYFEAPKGWNLTSATLGDWFEINKANIEFDYDKAMFDLANCKTIAKRISPLYKYSSKNGLPHGKIQDAKYCPVGIIKYKH